MPIYEYRCEDCGKQFEELTLSQSGAGVVSCRHCASQRVSRLLSVFAAHTHTASKAPEPGPCGGCGAAQRGMCGVD
jgi:putative FmdB family regulatory protein